MLLSPADFREIISGQRRGVSAALARGLLRVVETPYAWAMRCRNWAYDHRHKTIAQVDVPIVSVGNLTLGGTGKTPLVAWIARWLRGHDVRVTIVSRGYGAEEEGGRNDEALELEQRLPDVPHLQNPDRVAAARTAVEEFACQMILLDDGFQHRRLARDLDIVLLDACDPWGGGHVFPRGLLREPASGLARAHVVVLSRADMIDAAARRTVRDRVAGIVPHADWVEVIHAPCRLIGSTGTEALLATLVDRPIAAFCGVGNPAGFRHTLTECGAQFIAFREFPDHHPYERADVEALDRWAAGMEIDAVVCTHKDLVKLGVERLGGKPLWALEIEMRFLAGQAELEAQLSALLPAGE